MFYQLVYKPKANMHVLHQKRQNFHLWWQNNEIIDHFKVTNAILPGVQNYWGERAAKPEIANGVEE